MESTVNGTIDGSTHPSDKLGHLSIYKLDEECKRMQQLISDISTAI